ERPVVAEGLGEIDRQRFGCRDGEVVGRDAGAESGADALDECLRELGFADARGAVDAQNQGTRDLGHGGAPMAPGTRFIRREKSAGVPPPSVVRGGGPTRRGRRLLAPAGRVWGTRRG